MLRERVPMADRRAGVPRSDVYGRAGVANVQTAGPVVTRPPVEVVPGPEVVQGTTAVLVRTHDVSVDEVLGRA